MTYKKISNSNIIVIPNMQLLAHLSTHTVHHNLLSDLYLQTLFVKRAFLSLSTYLGMGTGEIYVITMASSWRADTSQHEHEHILAISCLAVSWRESCYHKIGLLERSDLFYDNSLENSKLKNDKSLNDKYILIILSYLIQCVLSVAYIFHRLLWPWWVY